MHIWGENAKFYVLYTALITLLLSLTVYHPSMPQNLSFRKFIGGLLKDMAKNIRHWLHLSLVAFVWLFIMPVCICESMLLCLYVYSSFWKQCGECSELCTCKNPPLTKISYVHHSVGGSACSSFSFVCLLCVYNHHTSSCYASQAGKVPKIKILTLFSAI